MLDKGVFLDLASLHPDDLVLDSLEKVIESWQWRMATPHTDLVSAIEDADVVVSNKVALGEKEMASAQNLKLICVAATGVNNIDLAAADRCGITVCNVPAYTTPSVVQHTFSLLLALTTQFIRYQNDVFDGSWSLSESFCLLDYPIRELDGLTMGIVGFGELGKAVASVAKAFGMRILVARRDDKDQRENRINLHEMLPQVDVLSLHCPLTATTRGLIGKTELALMKPDAVLINSARGGIVDEHALFEALQAGLIGGAALDVLEQEPPPADHFLLRHPLPNLIITPHTAWASRQSRQRLINGIAENIRAYMRGIPVNVVTEQS